MTVNQLYFFLSDRDPKVAWVRHEVHGVPQIGSRMRFNGDCYEVETVEYKRVQHGLGESAKVVLEPRIILKPYDGKLSIE